MGEAPTASCCPPITAALKAMVDTGIGLMGVWEGPKPPGDTGGKSSLSSLSDFLFSLSLVKAAAKLSGP